jgi:two-component system, OmpR family, phosphate regulon sensor histidine kinase PhoR
LLQKIRPHLLPGAAILVVATLTAMVAVPLILGTEREETRDRLSDELDPLEFALEDSRANLLALGLAGAATIEGGETERAAYETALANLETDLSMIRELSGTLEGSDRETVDGAVESTERYVSEVVAPVAELAAAGQVEEAQALQDEQAASLFFAADEAINESLDVTQEEVVAALDRNRDLDELGQTLTIVLGALATLSAAIVTYLAWSNQRAHRRSMESEAQALEAQRFAEESQARAEEAQRVAKTNEALSMELERRAREARSVAEEAARGEAEAKAAAETRAEEERVAQRQAQEDAATAERQRVIAEQARALSREAQDRAELSAAEAQIERGRLDAVFESMADGVAIFDKNGMPIRVNAAGERMWGIPEEEIKQLAPGEVTRPGRLLDEAGEEVGLEGLPSTIAIREDREVREMVFVLEKGEERMDILASAAPLHDAGGEVIGAVAVWHDVTEIRSVERLKDEFLSFAAHELRTPLTIVKGYASALARQLGDAEQKDMAQSIEEESDRIGSLISQLLDISRIEAGKLELNPRNVKVPELIEEVIERHRDVDPQREIVLNADGADFTCLADLEALKQVLDNLLSNARKYSNHGTPIQVDVETDGQVVRIAVRDQGVGIPGQEVERIGEKLFRASTSQGREGSGLGLYITRHYLEVQGGRLEIESEPGKGSTFTAVVPCPLDGDSPVAPGAESVVVTT